MLRHNAIPTFDSDNIATPELRDAFYTQGALIVKRLLSSHDLDPLAEFLIKILRLKYPNVSGAANRSEATSLASDLMLEAMSCSPEAQSVIYDVMCKSSATHALSTNPKLDSIITQILSDTVSLHEKKILIMSPPNETWHLARWHQDYYYNGGPEASCTVYAPLQATGQLNGGLSIALGAHKRGPIEHVAASATNKWNVISDSDISTFPQICDIEMSRGDVLFLHSLTPHSANKNTSNRMRFVANFRYQCLADQQFLSNDWQIPELTEARLALGKKNDQINERE